MKVRMVYVFCCTKTVPFFLPTEARVTIAYAHREWALLCTDDGLAKRKLGHQAYKKLRARLEDLASVESVADLVAGTPHPLVGDRTGQFALSLHGACRLVFRATDEPPPRLVAGGIAWNAVTSITIVFIGDYHD